MADQPIIVKKIKKAAEGHHGGSWKVAFADFMTAMMAFFLVMWIIGLDQETRSAIAGYFKDPVDFMKHSSGNRLASTLQDAPPRLKNARTTGPGSRVADKEEEKQLESVQEEVEVTLKSPEFSQLEDLVKTSMNEEGLKIEFVESAGNAFFQTGSALLNPPARELFKRIGQMLGAKNHTLIIDGHTDAQKYSPGAKYNNWNLSQDRASAVLQVLLISGVKEGNILACRGFADRRLRNKANPLDISNRRVSLLLPYSYKEEQVLGSYDKTDSGPPRIDIAGRLGESK